MPRGDHDHRMASLRKLDEAAREEQRLGRALKEAQKEALESEHPTGDSDVGAMLLLDDYPFLRAAARKVEAGESSGDDIEVREASTSHPR